MAQGIEAGKPGTADALPTARIAMVDPIEGTMP